MGEGTRLLRIPGTLVKDPANKTAPDYGGTRLGLVRDVLFLVETSVFEVPTEDYGPAELVELFNMGANFELRCALRDWDDDAFAAVFGNTFVGGTGGRRGLIHPQDASGELPGAPVSERSFSLLYAADNPANPSIYLRSVLPSPVERIEGSLGHTSDFLWAVRFVARRAPGDEDGSVQWQTLADITY